VRVGRIGFSPAHVGRQSGCAGAAIMAERPLSDRRQALDRAIVLKAAAQKAVETAAEPLRRCDAVIEEITGRGLSLPAYISATSALQANGSPADGKAWIRATPLSRKSFPGGEGRTKLQFSN